MITAILTVDWAGEEQQWGAVGLACAPSAGDVIKAWYGHDFHFVRVETVLHHSVEWPLEDDGLRSTVPSIQIFAKWVTMDLSTYRQ